MPNPNPKTTEEWEKEFERLCDISVLDGGFLGSYDRFAVEKAIPFIRKELAKATATARKEERRSRIRPDGFCDCPACEGGHRRKYLGGEGKEKRGGGN